MTVFDSSNQTGLYVYVDDDTTNVYVGMHHTEICVDVEDIPDIIGDFIMAYYLRGGDAAALVEHILGLGK